MAYTTVNKSTDYFNTKLYTGNASTNAITGVGFQPDWVWIKNRDAAEAHSLYDAVRGTQKVIYSNLTNAQATETNGLSSFDSDGFTVGSSGAINGSSQNIASWNWKANGAGSANTDGSISSTVSANTTSGFSIVTYTGTGSNATIGHGLNSAPSVVICKQLNATQQWINYHKAIGATKYLHLNAVDASATSSTVWNDTDPTSSVFSVGTAANCNGSGNTYVAYCFADVQGFSKVSGSYIGNGNADAPFLYTGFKPAFIMIKNASDGTKNWVILDNRRPSTGQNPADDILFPNTSDAESSSQTDRLVDFVSNGVKIRATSLQMNGSGNTHIYMAFAEAPLVSSNGVPAVAR